MARLVLLVGATLVLARHNTCLAFTPLPPSRRQAIHPVSMSTPANEERDELLKRASKLRQEASELEASRTRRRVVAATPASDAVYTAMDDSVWLFSYRFSDQPEPKEEAAANAPKRNFYSGKLILKFKRDGYTDIVSHEPSGTAGQAVTIVKAWGWDVEQSAEDDDKDYLLFSVDVSVPAAAAAATTTDRVTNKDKMQRFYFQARQESNGKSISLKEGTVTIKQDVVDSKASRWSFLSPRGILAEFRLVGNFVAKPVQVA